LDIFFCDTAHNRTMQPQGLIQKGTRI